jgi:rod shape-determining protein MreC
MPKSRLFPRILTAAVFIILEMAALHILGKNAQLQRLWIARGAHGFMGAVWGGTQRIKDYFSLRRTNEGLALENTRLMEENARMKELLDARELDTMGLSLKRQRGFRYLNAEVIKLSRNKQHNYLILSKGFEDGVSEKSGIITREGVIGIVDAVSAHYSYAFSFQNKDISISARLGEEGGTGLLVWDGQSSRGAILKEIPLQYKYHRGDTVYTSGHSLMFPPDVPLGVAGESKIINGATNEIQVTLFQDFTAIRYVTVVHNTAFDELEELEP